MSLIETGPAGSVGWKFFIASLVTYGAIATFAFRGQAIDFPLLSLIALFTFPFVVAQARHTWIILSIAKYIRVELDPYLPRTAVTAAPRYMRHWDESEVMSDKMPMFLRVEAVVHILLLCGPAVAVLWLDRPRHWPDVGLIYAAGFVGTFLSITYLFLQSRFRIWAPPPLRNQVQTDAKMRKLVNHLYNNHFSESVLLGAVSVIALLDVVRIAQALHHGTGNAFIFVASTSVFAAWVVVFKQFRAAKQSKTIPPVLVALLAMLVMILATVILSY